MLTPMRSAFSAVTWMPLVLHRLDARRHAVMDEGIHMARFLAIQVLGEVETLYLAGDLAGEARWVEAADPG